MKSLSTHIVEGLNNEIRESLMINEGSNDLQIAKIAKTTNKRQELGITYLKLYKDMVGEVGTQELNRMMKSYVRGAGGKTQQTMYDLIDLGLIVRVKRGVYKIVKAQFLTDLETLLNDKSPRPWINNVDYTRKEMKQVIEETKALPSMSKLKTLTNVGMMDRYLAFQLDGIWFKHEGKIYEEGHTIGGAWSFDATKIDEIIQHTKSVEDYFLSYVFTK